MKWIAVILAMLNLVVFLLMKAYPTAVETIPVTEFEAINESAMSVVLPEVKDIEMAVVPETGLQDELQEESLTQLKVDERGQVLMARKPDQPVPEGVEAAIEPTAVVKNDSRTTEPESMPVLKPLDRRQDAAPAVVPVTKPKVVEKPAAVVKAPVAKPKPVAPAVVAPALACYRIGPFGNQNELTAIRHKLDSSSIKYRVEEKTAAGKIKAVRVYLGAFPNQTVLAEQKARLEKMKIEHFVIRLNGEQLIQLGYFSEPARALSYQKKLKARKVDAKTATIYRETGINSWLNTGSASVTAIDGLTLPRGVKRQKQACR